MSNDQIHSYSSYDALIDRALQETDMPENERHSRYKDREWAGASWEKSVKLARTGDLEGARRLAPAMLNGASEMVMKMARFDPVFKLEEGRWVDVARYLNGEPECWGDFEQSDTMPRKGLALILNADFSAGIQPDQIDKVGAAVGSVVLGLQALGYAVLVYYCTKNKSYDGYSLTFSAPLNPGATPLDASRLSAVLRPWFLRRIMFSAWETCDKTTRERLGVTAWGGYGQVGYLTPQESAGIAQGAQHIVLDMAGYVHNVDRIQKDVMSALSAEQVPV